MKKVPDIDVQIAFGNDLSGVVTGAALSWALTLWKISRIVILAEVVEDEVSLLSFCKYKGASDVGSTNRPSASRPGVYH